MMKSDTAGTGFGFTVCTVTGSGALATKKIERAPSGEIVQKDYTKAAYRWHMKPRHEPTLEAMATRLKAMASDTASMIVMGEPLPHVDLSAAQPRRWARPDPAENTLAAVPRAWLAIDVDDATVPAPLGQGDKLVAAAIHVRDYLLPNAFAGVRMIATATSSTGRKGDTLARLRLWALLDKPHPIEALRQWAKGARTSDYPVDPAVMQAGQPIYTARPIFVGVPDPVPADLWAVVLPGERERVVLDANEFERSYAASMFRVKAAATAAGMDWRKLMETTVGTDGFCFPLEQGLGAAVRAGAAITEAVGFALALVQERADPGRKAQYTEQWLRAAFLSFQRRDREGAARIAAAKARLFTQTLTTGVNAAQRQEGRMK